MFAKAPPAYFHRSADNTKSNAAIAAALQQEEKNKAKAAPSFLPTWLGGKTKIQTNMEAAEAAVEAEKADLAAFWAQRAAENKIMQNRFNAEMAAQRNGRNAALRAGASPEEANRAGDAVANEREEAKRHANLGFTRTPEEQARREAKVVANAIAKAKRKAADKVINDAWRATHKNYFNKLRAENEAAGKAVAAVLAAQKANKATKKRQRGGAYRVTGKKARKGGKTLKSITKRRQQTRKQ
jgi:hypothetical protein